jgi:uncharacterized lipoprotein YmbA
MTRGLFASLILAASALAGCASSPTPRFYILSAPEQPAAKAAYSVAVGPVTVPEIVDRAQLVLRTSANEVTIAEQTRWAQSLKSEIPRVIAANLAQSLGDAYVSAYPQGTGSEADYRVVVDIQRFESALGDAATVEALWAVSATTGKSGAPRSGRSLVREPVQGRDYDALVAAHSRALASISRDIAEAVRAARAARAVQ